MQALEKSLEEEMVFEILSYELAKEITKIKYMVYEDAETAEKRKNEYVKNLKKINFDLGAGIAKEKSKVKVEKLDEFGLAVSNYVTLALSGAQETVNSQKITQEGDTVISKNTFGEEQYEMRVQKQEAKKIMDEQTKILVAKYKAEHGETQ